MLYVYLLESYAPYLGIDTDQPDLALVVGTSSRRRLASAARSHRTSPRS
jgi:hypothetical protein